METKIWRRRLSSLKVILKIARKIVVTVKICTYTSYLPILKVFVFFCGRVCVVSVDLLTICIPVDRFKVSGAYHTLDSLRARFNETQSGDVRLLLFLSCHSTRPFQNPGEASVPLLKAVRREELAGRIWDSLVVTDLLQSWWAGWLFHEWGQQHWRKFRCFFHIFLSLSEFCLPGRWIGYWRVYSSQAIFAAR